MASEQQYIQWCIWWLQSCLSAVSSKCNHDSSYSGLSPSAASPTIYYPPTKSLATVIPATHSSPSSVSTSSMWQHTFAFRIMSKSSSDFKMVPTSTTKEVQGEETFCCNFLTTDQEWNAPLGTFTSSSVHQNSTNPIQLCTLDYEFLLSMEECAKWTLKSLQKMMQLFYWVIHLELLHCGQSYFSSQSVLLEMMMTRSFNCS